MPIPTSKPLSLSAVQTEYGGTNPISMSEYRGLGNAPASGAIDLWGDFNGTSAWPGNITLYEQLVSTMFTSVSGNTATASNGMTVTKSPYVEWEGINSEGVIGGYHLVVGTGTNAFYYSESMNSIYQSGTTNSIGNSSYTFGGTGAWSDYVGGYLYITMTGGGAPGCSGYDYSSSTDNFNLTVSATGTSSQTKTLYFTDYASGNTITHKIPISSANGGITYTVDPVATTRSNLSPCGEWSLSASISKMEIKET